MLPGTYLLKKESDSMEWIARNSSLTLEEMNNNAEIITNYYRASDFSDATIVAMLSNMQAESSINPMRHEVGGGGGYGLVQWTPKSKLDNFIVTLGLIDSDNGDNQLDVLHAQLTGNGLPKDFNTSQSQINYYASSGATQNMVGISADEFITNSRNLTTAELTILFMIAYERPSYDPNVNHINDRINNNSHWQSIVDNVQSFTPRTNTDGLNASNPYYTSMNVYHPEYSAYGVGGSVGLGNCTWYAYGRYGEASGKMPTGITGNGNEFYQQSIAAGLKTGQQPKVGAIIGFGSSSPNYPYGHVCFIEKIENDTIYISDSNYGTNGTDGWFFRYYTLDQLQRESPFLYIQGYIYADVNTPSRYDKPKISIEHSKNGSMMIVDVNVIVDAKLQLTEIKVDIDNYHDRATSSPATFRYKLKRGKNKLTIKVSATDSANQTTIESIDVEYYGNNDITPLYMVKIIGGGYNEH